jgi:hypothetical protein
MPARCAVVTETAFAHTGVGGKHLEPRDRLPEQDRGARSQDVGEEPGGQVR